MKQSRLLKELSLEECQKVSGGEDDKEEKPIKMKGKFNWGEDKEHNKKYIQGKLGLGTEDDWDFYFDGKLDEKGSKSVGVQFELNLI